MAEIIKFPKINSNEIIPPKVVLESAIAADMRHVVVVGTNQDGSLFAASSSGHIGDVVLMMERARLFLLDLAEENNVFP